MLKIANSIDSTLGNYLLLAKIYFGENSPASNFLRQKIAESPGGFDEEVIADQNQMLMMLVDLHKGGEPNTEITP